MKSSTWPIHAGTHILHPLCHFILKTILYPLYFCLKVKLREVMPLTQSHRASYLYVVVFRLRLLVSHIEERAWLPPVESNSRRRQRRLGSLVTALSPPWRGRSLGLREPPTRRGPCFSSRQWTWFMFRSQVPASFARRLLAGPAVSVTRDWIAGERSPLCVLWMKNTPFRERIQLVFHRERRQTGLVNRENNVHHSPDFYLTPKPGDQPGERPPRATQRGAHWGHLGVWGEGSVVEKNEPGGPDLAPSLCTLANLTPGAS